MRTWCGLTIMCAYDRVVERQFFEELVELTINIQVDLAELEKAGAMRGFLLGLDPERDPKELDTAIDKVVEQFMHKRKRLADKLDLIAQCPGKDVKLS
jgi:hypothetical protein